MLAITDLSLIVTMRGLELRVFTGVLLYRLAPHNETVARSAGSTYVPVVMAVVTLSSHRWVSILPMKWRACSLPVASQYRARQWPSDRLAMLVMMVLLLGGQGRAPFRLDPRDQVLFG
jgi:hypothetical protein